MLHIRLAGVCASFVPQVFLVVDHRVGTFERDQLRQAAGKSNEVLRQLGPDIQWVESYVAGDKTFCVYLAKDEAIIRKHSEISGFPATRITEISKTIDPTTEKAA